MIPNIIHQMARTATLTWEEARLTARLRRMLPGWQYHLWTNQDQLRLVREHFPHLAERHEAIPYGVARTDIVKYVCMYAYGGFYVDTDYKLLRAFDEEALAPAAIIASEGADPQRGPSDPTYLGLGSALLGSRKGYPFWARLIEHIFEHNRPETMRGREEIIESTGPEAMTRFYMAHRDEFTGIRIIDKNLFFPGISLLGTRSTADARTYGIHLYWGSWRDKSLNVALRTGLRRKLNGLLA